MTRSVGLSKTSCKFYSLAVLGCWWWYMCKSLTKLMEISDVFIWGQWIQRPKRIIYLPQWEPFYLYIYDCYVGAIDISIATMSKEHRSTMKFTFWGLSLSIFYRIRGPTHLTHFSRSSDYKIEDSFIEGEQMHIYTQQYYISFMHNCLNDTLYRHNTSSTVCMTVGNSWCSRNTSWLCFNQMPAYPLDWWLPSSNRNRKVYHPCL